MGVIIYRLFTGFYFFLIRVSSLYNTKAKLWVKGRRGVFQKIEECLHNKSSNRIWLHCASLGEFEQARPFIEKIKSKDSSIVVIVTFFSPSGYEVRKSYDKADGIFYLPTDSVRNARRFFKLVEPTKIYFVKYEFWYFYLSHAFKNNIPTYLISATFRKEQLFFKWYGGFYKNILKGFNKVFVQDLDSYNLLQSEGIKQVELAGDTRFDRVAEISEKVKPIDYISDFKGDKKLLILGSSWEPEETFLEKYLEQENPDIKVIIAPHDISPKHINQVQLKFVDAQLYSTANEKNVKESSVLIIDSIGLLASLYQYADIAFVGGAFGSGLHNVLEPAAFKMPIIFGVKIHKFPEAYKLISIGAGFRVSTFDDFKETMDTLLNNPHPRQLAREACEKYINENKGATNKILEATT